MNLCQMENTNLKKNKSAIFYWIPANKSLTREESSKTKLLHNQIQAILTDTIKWSLDYVNCLNFPVWDCLLARKHRDGHSIGQGQCMDTWEGSFLK